MALDSEAGNKYEKKIVSILKKAKVLPRGFKSEPGDHGPDAAFVKNGVTYYVEVKHVFNTSYGETRVIHDGKKWRFRDPASLKPAALELDEILASRNILRKVEEFYKGLGVPLMFTEKKLTEDQRRRDIMKFGGRSTTFEIPASTANMYYRAKGIDYIQIQGFGFFHLGRDPAKIGCPLFSSPRMIVELRLKHSPQPYYYFTLTAKITGVAKTSSKFDIDKDVSFLMNSK